MNFLPRKKQGNAEKHTGAVNPHIRKAAVPPGDEKLNRFVCAGNGGAAEKGEPFAFGVSLPQQVQHHAKGGKFQKVSRFANQPASGSAGERRTGKQLSNNILHPIADLPGDMAGQQGVPPNNGQVQNKPCG